MVQQRSCLFCSAWNICNLQGNRDGPLPRLCPMCDTKQVLLSKLQHRALCSFQCKLAPTSLAVMPALLHTFPIPTPTATGGCATIQSHALENGSRERLSCHQPKEYGCWIRQFKIPTRDTCRPRSETKQHWANIQPYQVMPQRAVTGTIRAKVAVYLPSGKGTLICRHQIRSC